MTLIEEQQAKFLSQWTIDQVGMSHDIESEAILYDEFYSALNRWVEDSPKLNLKKPTASMVESFGQYVEKSYSYPRHKFVDLLNIFNRGLSHHVETQKRIVFRAPPSESHPIKKSAVTSLERAQALLKHHQRNLLPETDLGSDSAVGELWIALIFRCLCLEDRFVSAIIEQLHEPIYYSEPWCWITLNFMDSQKNGLKSRRLLFDPLSGALWSRLDLQNVKAWQRSTQKLPKGQTFKTIIMKAVRSYLENTGYPPKLVPSSYDQLVRDAKTLWGLRLSPLLIDYACGAHFSTSMPEATWRRIMGFQPLPVTPEDPKAPLPSRVEPADSSLDGFQPLRNALKKDYSACKIELAALKSTLPPNHHTWLVSHWLIALFAQRINLRTSSGKPPSPAGLATTLGAMGTRLEVVFKGDPPASLAPEDRWLRYEEALESTDSANVRPRLLNGIRLFDQLIAQLNNEQPIDWTFQLDNPRVDFLTSANLISFDMLEELAGDLSSPASPFTNPDTRERAQIAVILGGKTGMRRSEIWGLQVSDIHRDSIIVQKNTFRRLKTGNATRRASLLLLTEEERNVLAKLKEQKSTLPLSESGQGELIPSSAGPISTDYLFRETGASNGNIHPETDGAHFFTTISKAMTTLSGDSTLHFHHLRHTLASWLAMFLLSDDLGLYRFELKVFLGDKNTHLQPLIDCIKASCREGGEIYTLANLLGHSSPKTTLQYYIHTMDLALHMAATLPLEGGLDNAYATLAGLSRPRDGARLHRQRIIDHEASDSTTNPDTVKKNEKARASIFKKLSKGRAISVERIEENADVTEFLAASEAAKRRLSNWLALNQRGDDNEELKESSLITALASMDLLPPENGIAYDVAHKFLTNILQTRKSVSDKDYAWMLERIVARYNRHKNYSVLKHAEAKKINAWLKKFSGDQYALTRLDIQGKFARGTTPYRLSLHGTRSSQKASRPLYWIIFALHHEMMTL